MSSKCKKVLGVVLSVVLLVSLLSSCSGSGKDNTAPKPAEQAAPAATKAPEGPEPLTLPIVKTPITATIFWEMDAKMSMTMKSYSEMGFFKEMAKRTGITFEFKHPPSGQAKEQFNLMLASKEYPDMAHYDHATIPGGPAKAVADGVYVKLNDMINKYMPNFKKTLDEHPDWKKQLSSDDGTIATIPKIKRDKYTLLSNGFQIRKDWLDRLGLKEPATMDDWYNVLTAFKQKDANGNGDPNDEIPFISIGSTSKSFTNFAMAWGLKTGFYMDGNKVKYGPVEPAFKNYLETMAKWYKEGLIDKDYLSTDSKLFESKLGGDKGGAYYNTINGTMGKFLSDWEKAKKPYTLVGAKYPIGPAGKAYAEYDWPVNSSGVAIFTTSKYQKELVKWFDYLFTPEGILVSNYGIEGESYKMVNGKPELTDAIMKNPKLPVINALCQYTYSLATGPGLQIAEVFKAQQVSPIQDQTVQKYTEASNALDVPLISIGADDGKKLSQIMGDINTYYEEMFNKMVMGAEPMSSYDKFVKTIKDMGIDNALKIEQDAYDRFQKR